MSQNNKLYKRDKRTAFKELAEKRVNRILDMIRLLGNLSNRSNYDYTDDEIKKIFATITKKLEETKKLFVIIDKEEKFRL